jgi:hypothetical protein
MRTADDKTDSVAFLYRNKEDNSIQSASISVSKDENCSQEKNTDFMNAYYFALLLASTANAIEEFEEDKLNIYNYRNFSWQQNTMQQEASTSNSATITTTNTNSIVGRYNLLPPNSNQNQQQNLVGEQAEQEAPNKTNSSNTMGLNGKRQ